MPKRFDVFLSHNSKDKPAVRELAEALRARGLEVWLDEQCLLPGQRWQEELEKVLRTVRAGTVLVGKDGFGPWEDQEMRVLLSQAVKRSIPVIPVLLPGCPRQPELPPFLEQFTWSDLRDGLAPEALDRLAEGIRPRPAGPPGKARPDPLDLPETFRYDAFVSYRHVEPDLGFARSLVRRLENAGFRVAIDERDFRPEQTLLEEMERCIRESRFTLAVLSPRYLESGNTWEEAIISKVLDMGERRRRLMPLILEPVERPMWLYNIVGIDFGQTKGLVDPFARLQAALCSPQGASAETSPGPEPSWPDEATKRLAETLDGLYRREEKVVSAGEDPTAVRQEILAARRELREGGRLQAGDFLAGGRFHLLKPLGQGGFATVWMAFDRKEREVVAVKVLHGQHTGDRSQRERFFRGARKMAELHHQGIVRVVEKHLADGGFHFFIMEYLPGGDLRKAVLDKLLAPQAVLPLLQEVAAALTFAHEHGMIHRDVKPANVLLDAKGRAKLTDFDLVRAADTTGGTLGGGMLGTFLYMAPEAMSSPQEAGVAADVYSFAMTAAFCLYGAELPVEVLRDANSFLRRLPCPAGVHTALRKAAAWEPNKRFPSIAELSRALAEGAADVPAPEVSREGQTPVTFGRRRAFLTIKKKGPKREYQDFTIDLHSAEDGNIEATVVESPLEDNCRVFFAKPVAQEDVDLYLSALAVRGDATDALSLPPRQMGEQIFNGLFGADLGKLFVRCRDFATHSSSLRGLRVRLRFHLDDPMASYLAAVPWERMWEPGREGYLAIDADTPLVREIAGVRRKALEVEPPLRILVVAAAPTTMKSSNLNLEIERMTAALQPLLEAGTVELLRLSNKATKHALLDVLLEKEIHVLHFVGHGGYHSASGTGAIFLETEDGDADQVDGEELAAYLKGSRALRLVVLNADKTARYAGSGGGARRNVGLATAILTRTGVTAVVANQGSISDATASAFSRIFYGRLANGDAIDEAMTEARLRLWAQTQEWATPVLFLAAPNGEIVSAEEARNDAPSPSEDQS